MTSPARSTRSGHNAGDQQPLNYRDATADAPRTLAAALADHAAGPIQADLVASAAYRNGREVTR